MKKEIWFIRHGQSVVNAGGTWDDSATIPLTEIGHQQAKAASETLVHEPTLVITSPYSRTLETARPTLDRWPDAQHEEWPIHEFDYLCIEKLRGKTVEDFHAQNTTYWDRKDPHYKDGPEAESFVSLMSRVDDTVNRISKLTHTKSVIFSHALFMKALFFRFKNPDVNVEKMQEFKTVFLEYKISNTAIAHFSFHPDGEIEMHTMSADHIDEEHR